MTSPKEFCSKCKQLLKLGEVVTGLSWNGDGGSHVNCPDPVPAETQVDYLPVDARTGVYEIK